MEINDISLKTLNAQANKRIQKGCKGLANLKNVGNGIA